MEHKEFLPLWTILPFIGLLASIAIMPLINGKWWHHNFPKVSFIFALPTGLYILKINPHWLLETFIDYVAFIVLLASLFIIAGGIVIKNQFKDSPIANSICLLAGAILANFIGTTGASMLLIRPFLKINTDRKHKAYLVVFFIFIVSNIGGSLTALGDPPLFLGFLKGVPFFWTLHLLPLWSFTILTLVCLFFLWDSYYLKKHHPEKQAIYKISTSHKSITLKGIKIEGAINLLFFVGVITAILIHASLPPKFGYFKEFIQVTIIIIMSILSLKFTQKKYRVANEFSWFPIKEVAILFAGIFTCMIPALEILETKGAALGVTKPWQFFWCAGVLSSFLDNAPTYLTFMTLGKTLHLAGPVVKLAEGAINAKILLAVSAGAVFMGANTYIGNGPNFMVKSIAEGFKVNTPSFIGYMLYSICILIPLFIAVTFIFLL